MQQPLRQQCLHIAPSVGNQLIQPDSMAIVNRWFFPTNRLRFLYSHS